MPTADCLWDLECSLKGIIELSESSQHPIRPADINSDLVELHFSQVRSLFYNPTPNVLQYASIQNSIILGQRYAFADTKTNSEACYPKPVTMYRR